MLSLVKTSYHQKLTVNTFSAYHTAFFKIFFSGPKKINACEIGLEKKSEILWWIRPLEWMSLKQNINLIYNVGPHSASDFRLFGRQRDHCRMNCIKEKWILQNSLPLIPRIWYVSSQFGAISKWDQNPVFGQDSGHLNDLNFTSRLQSHVGRDWWIITSWKTNVGFFRAW